MLRPARPEDAGACFAAVTESLPELMRWLPWVHEGYAREETEAWIGFCAEQWTIEDGNRDFFIFDTSGAFLGGCGLARTTPDGWAIGYWVRSSACGRGVATAATRLLVRLGADLGLDPIVVEVDPGNGASIRVAEKAGGVRGPSRRHAHDDGSVHELIPFTLAPEARQRR